MVVGAVFNMFRILVLPLLFYLIYQNITSSLGWAMIVLILAFASNFLEDILIGKRGEKKVRSFLHPFIEKIVVMGLLLIYAIEGDFWWTLLGIFIARDLLIGYLRWIATRDDVLIEEGMDIRVLSTLQFAIALGLIIYNYMILSESLAFISPEIIAALIFLLSITAGIVALYTLGGSSWTYFKKLQERKISCEYKPHHRLLVFVNLLSGSSKNRYRRHLLKLFSRRRKAPLIYLNGNKNFFQGTVQKIKRVDHVVIAGGDGTFESALNYSPLQKKPLGFFPLGKGNAFYSYFYRGKRFEYLRSRFGFREVDLDVLELEWNDRKIQTEFLSIGIDAEVMRLSADRKHKGFWAYFRAGAQAAATAQGSFDLKIKIDKKNHSWNNCFNITLGKIPYYGFGVRSLFHVQPDDGLVYGLGHVNTHAAIFNKALRLWTLIMVNMGYNKPPVIDFKGKVIEVRSLVLFPLQAGGEFLGFTNQIKVKVVRKQKVLMI